jgi:galactokinase
VVARVLESGGRALSAFARHFGRPADATGEAPGRVNLIGEHTDYNGGLVLPTAIPQRTRVELALRADGVVRAASTTVAVADPVSYVLGAESPGGGWLDYLQGVTHVLRAEGQHVAGADVLVSSSVPPGRGLASSAALTVAFLRALRAAHRLALDDVALARLAQRAECELVGARVGIMDQMAASLAAPGTALFLDARSLAWERVALPRHMDLVVLDSGITHAHAHGGYNARRAECERAAALAGVGTLREIDADRLAGLALPPPLDRRVRHVVGENARVTAAVAALRAGDVERLGALFVASHESLRDDFEVSLPEVDALVALACADRDVLGARLTGGGFGGAVVALTRAGTGAAAGARIARAYVAETGRPGAVLVPEGGST